LSLRVIPIYARGDRPTWFVPTTVGDRVLQDWPDSALKGGLRVRRFLEGLLGEPPLAYTARDQALSLDHLWGLWFHLTNRCNQVRRHCLFVPFPRFSGSCGL